MLKSRNKTRNRQKVGRVRGSVWFRAVPYKEMKLGVPYWPNPPREWSKRMCFSFRSSSGCSDQIWDIFRLLNLSYQDEDAGVKFLVAQKLTTWRAATEL